MSVTLDRLRERVATATDEKSRFYALTRLAIELAQLGRAQEARDVIGALRASATIGGSGLLAIYLVLIDGICSYYDGLQLISLDRLNRAHALSVASGDRRLVGEAGVWLALASYSFDKLDSLERSLVSAAKCADVLETSTAARLSAVLADLWQLVGSTTDSATWYMHSRRLARKDQDDAVLVAIEFNRLAAGLTRLKFEEFLGYDGLASDSRAWDLEIASVEALHRAYRSDALGHLLVLCNARRKYFAGDAAGSISLLGRLHGEQRWSEVGLDLHALRAELAWCKVLAGELTVVTGADFPSMDEIRGLDSGTKIDCLFYAARIGERLAAAWNLIEIHEMLDVEKVALSSNLHFFERLCSEVVRIDGMQRIASQSS